MCLICEFISSSPYLTQDSHIIRAYTVLLTVGGINTPFILGEYLFHRHLTVYLYPLRQRLIRPMGNFRCLHGRLQRQHQIIPTINIQLNANASFALIWRFENGDIRHGPDRVRYRRSCRADARAPVFRRHQPDEYDSHGIWCCGNFWIGISCE